MQAVFDVVEADPDATRAGYEAMGPEGSADGCICYPCQNFRVARARVYPTEFLDLLNALGVDPRREDDVNDFGPREATWSEDYEHGRGSWRDWKWMYEGDFRTFGRVSQGRTHPEDKASKASSKYETRVGPFFSYELYRGNVPRRGPMRGSPFRDPSKTFVITFMAEDVPWLLDGPPWDMPSESI